MVTIMCTMKLQKALVAAGQHWTRGNAPKACGVGRLGNWAATLVDEGTPVVVAVNDITCLTLLVAMKPVRRLRDRLAAALCQALLERKVPRRVVNGECEEIAAAQFARLRDPRLREELAFAEFETAAHGSEGQDIASIQRMLNTYPYSGIGAEDPNAAVRILLADPVA